MQDNVIKLKLLDFDDKAKALCLRVGSVSFEEAERELLRETVRAVPVLKKAAEILGISRSALYAKLYRYGFVAREESKDPAGRATLALVLDGPAPVTVQVEAPPPEQSTSGSSDDEDAS